MGLLEIMLGLCLIFLFLIFVLFLYCAIAINEEMEIDLKDNYDSNNKKRR